MRRIGILIVMACAAASSGCLCRGVCTKRISEEKCPTDIRRTHFWCFGEDAIIQGPCGPKEELYGYEPTCWREFPQVAAACYGQEYADQLNPHPSEVQRLPPLPPQEALPEPASPEPVIDPVRAIDPELPPQSQGPAGDSAMRPTPFAMGPGAKPTAASGFMVQLDESKVQIQPGPVAGASVAGASTTRLLATDQLLAPTGEPTPPQRGEVNIAAIDMGARSGVVGWLAKNPSRQGELSRWAPVELPSAAARETKESREVRSKYALDASATPSLDDMHPGADASLQRIAPTFTR